MPASQALKGRWRPELDKHPGAVIVRKHFHLVLETVDKLAAERSRVASDNTLSDIGRAQKMQKAAVDHAAPVAKAIRALAAGHEAVQKQQLALTPTVKDKRDLASAMLRQEVRAMMRETGKAYQIASAPDADPLVVEAIFEAPLALSGITADQRKHLLAAVVERTGGPAVAAIKDQNEALTLLSSALRKSTEALQAAAGVTPYQFDKWLTDVAPLDPKEADAETAAFNAEAIGAAATALPLAARKTLIDQLLATNVAEISA